MNIILIGPPNSGKTTVGNLVAEKLDYTFVDLDNLIEEEGGQKSCKEIFASKGEQLFRKLEYAVLTRLEKSLPQQTVIATGGGCLQDPRTSNILKNLGLIVFLSAKSDIVWKRMAQKGLPAYLEQHNPKSCLEKLLAKRYPPYEDAADIKIEVGNQTPIMIAEHIISKTPYPILIGKNTLNRPELIETLKSVSASQFVIITDSHVEKLYGTNFAKTLKSRGFAVSLISFPAGEKYKTRETKEFLENHLLQLGAGRDTCIIGLGGGVVTDLAGFVASTYCRGIPSVMIPTTLLAMVDASIGGKTGVNAPQGKNLIGSFYSPTAIIIDTTTLHTLPVAELKNGIVEMIKHGLIQDRKTFDFLKGNAKSLLAYDIELLEKGIVDSIEIKTKIVARDEKEHGIRRLLNFGHTIGHAIETVSNYAIAHGRAVAIGIVKESYLSMCLGHLPENEYQEILEIFALYEIDTHCTVPIERLFQEMQMDKKSIRKKPRFIILQEIGKPLQCSQEYCQEISKAFLEENLVKK